MASRYSKLVRDALANKAQGSKQKPINSPWKDPTTLLLKKPQEQQQVPELLSEAVLAEHGACYTSEQFVLTTSRRLPSTKQMMRLADLVLAELVSPSTIRYAATRSATDM